MIKNRNEEKLTYGEMEFIARKAMQSALDEYVIPAHDPNSLTFGGGVADGVGVFEIYIAGETPLDAVVLCRTTINPCDGKTTVDVLLERKS